MTLLYFENEVVSNNVHVNQRVDSHIYVATSRALVSRPYNGLTMSTGSTHLACLGLCPFKTGSYAP